MKEINWNNQFSVGIKAWLHKRKIIIHRSDRTQFFIRPCLYFLGFCFINTSLLSRSRAVAPPFFCTAWLLTFDFLVVRRLGVWWLRSCGSPCCRKSLCICYTPAKSTKCNCNPLSMPVFDWLLIPSKSLQKPSNKCNPRNQPVKVNWWRIPKIIMTFVVDIPSLQRMNLNIPEVSCRATNRTKCSLLHRKNLNLIGKMLITSHSCFPEDEPFFILIKTWLNFRTNLIFFKL